MDRISTKRRSANMSKIKGKNTKPEIRVRRLLHSFGYRFRLHRRDLPGTPDIVLPRYRLAVFVNGCFWHRHSGCRFATTPKSNVNFWNQKFLGTVERDQRAMEALQVMGCTGCFTQRARLCLFLQQGEVA